MSVTIIRRVQQVVLRKDNGKMLVRAVSSGGLPAATGNDGYALIEVDGLPRFRAIRQSWITPAFDITSFAAASSIIVETGATISTPSFTAAYNRAPAVATFTDADANTLDVSLNPTAWSVPFSYVRTADDATLAMALTAEDDEGEVDSATLSARWMPASFVGVGPDGQSGEAWIESLTKTLVSLASRSFTVAPGAGEWIYYAYPDHYGPATFVVGGFEGGFDLVEVVAVTNAYGVTQNYRLYQSVQPNLGSVTVQVTT